MKKHIEKVGFFLLGTILTASIFILDWRTDRSEAIQTLAAGIVAGDFCTFDEAKDVQTITSEIEEIYFVGCGGFF